MEVVLVKWRRHTTKLNSLVSIYANRQGIAIAYRTRISPTPEFRFCEYFSCSSEEQEEKLTAVISQRLLQGTECHYLLDPQEYRLLLLDAPNVPEDEMPSAARWLVKDLIDFPINDASVETFPVPVRSGQSPKIYVVVCRQNRLVEIVEMMKVTGLKLVKIDIPELAMRNVLSWCPEVTQGVALLSLGKKFANLMIVRDDLIYLSRPIDENPVETAIGEEEIVDSPKIIPEEENRLEISRHGRVIMSESTSEVKSSSRIDSEMSHLSIPNLVLEIQRSLDYYQSQMGQQPPASLYIAPSLNVEDSLLGELSRAFSFSVKMLDINEFISFTSPLEYEKQTQCILAIGGGTATRKNEESKI